MEAAVEFATIPRMTRRQNPSATSTAAVADRLILTREATGLKQAAFCRRIGVSQQAWNNYESGRNRISLDQAMKVCVGTGVSLDWIYRGLMGGLPLDLATKIQDLVEAKLKKTA